MERSKATILDYVFRTRKFWLLGLLVLAGMVLALGTEEMLTGKTVGIPLTAVLTLWPFWLTWVPSVAVLSLAVKGMGWAPDWDATLAGQVLAAYGLLAAVLLGGWWYRRRSRRPWQV